MTQPELQWGSIIDYWIGLSISVSPSNVSLNIQFAVTEERKQNELTAEETLLSLNINSSDQCLTLVPLTAGTDQYY